MKDVFNQLFIGFKFTNYINDDVDNFLKLHNRKIVAEHTKEVANECKIIAEKFGVDVQKAELAGLLHDISAAFSFDARLNISNSLGLEVLNEEKEFPLILHQKISAVMAQDVWNINDEHVLSAIGCHTTLKRNYSELDLVLFIADKIKWDQKGIPPYIEQVEEGLKISLEHAAYEYINYLMENKENLKVIHPWLIGAYENLNFKIN